MVLNTQSLNQQKAEEPEKTGEMRIDAEGRGYWHSFKKDKVAPVVPAPVKAVVEEKPVEKAEPSKKQKGKKK